MADYMSSISNYTIKGKDILPMFSEACFDLTNAKIVNADRKISEILKVIATSELLSEIVAECACNFDFVSTYENAKLRTGQSKSLLPPTSPSEFIAFAVNLLFTLDTKSIVLADFLEEFYFAGQGITKSFVSFAKHIIIPFMETVFDYIEKRENPEQAEQATEKKLFSDEVEDEIKERKIGRASCRERVYVLV